MIEPLLKDKTVGGIVYTSNYWRPEWFNKLGNKGKKSLFKLEIDWQEFVIGLRTCDTTSDRTSNSIDPTHKMIGFCCIIMR